MALKQSDLPLLYAGRKEDVVSAWALEVYLTPRPSAAGLHGRSAGLPRLTRVTFMIPEVTAWRAPLDKQVQYYLCLLQYAGMGGIRSPYG